MNNLVGVILILFIFEVFASGCENISDPEQRLNCYDNQPSKNSDLNVDALSHHEKEAKEQFKYWFKDPNSIVFDDLEVVVSTKGVESLCGMVNGKNSYGGYVGFKPFYFNKEKWEVNSEKSKRFYFYWNKYCEGKNYDSSWAYSNEKKYLKSVSDDDSAISFRCLKGNKLGIEIYTDKGHKKEKPKKNTTVMKVFAEDDVAFDIRGDLEDINTAIWEVPRRHVDLIDSIWKGVYITIKLADSREITYYLTSEFQEKLRQFKIDCPNKRF